MKNEKAMEEAQSLVDRTSICMLGSIDNVGYPNIRAMIKMKNEGLHTIWFSTNTSSRKISQLRSNQKTCVYFVDLEKWIGLMLIGTIEILQDTESRKHLWQDGFEKYYPAGVNDPDYSVLRFTARSGKYYHALTHATFEL